MVERVSWLRAVLGGDCAGGLEILGLVMATSERVKPKKPRPPAAKKPSKDNENKVAIPEEWRLTQEQQDFIDLFNQDENKPQ